MPSLMRMPSAARHVLSNVFPGFFQPNGTAPAETSNGFSSSKVGAFSTPQPQRASALRPRRLSEVAEAVAEHETMKAGGIEHWEPDAHSKELLRATWSDDFEDLYQLGSEIYIYIFTSTPAVKQLFPYMARYEGDNFRDSKEFRSQALKFVQTIAHVVKNVYHMERLESFLYGIGQRHVAFAARGFKPEYWDVFQDAMEHALSKRMEASSTLNEAERKQAITVWRTIALYIITHMKNGYFDGLKNVNKFENGPEKY